VEKRVRHIFLFVFIIFFVFNGLKAVKKELFSDTEINNYGLLSPDNIDEKVIRQRFVKIDFSLLRQTENNKKTVIAKQIDLNLFSDKIITAQFDHLVNNKSGSFTWIGQVQGEELMGVILTVRNNTMSGSISVRNKNYSIRSAGFDGIHIIKEDNHSKYPECMEPVPTPERKFSVDEIGYDDGSVIDIMVVYTQSARAVVGGTVAMETLIDQAVAETNTGYANSNITQRINLVHTAEIVYTELSGSSGWSTTLNRLTNDNDGYMDEVHSLRDTYGADLVIMIQNEGTYCGLAWLNSNESHGFSLVHYSCATGYYSFAHEMGHNMGARHDRYVDNTDFSNYTYNHGYVSIPGDWRTIMAYNTDCSENGDGYCTRLNYWSNPNIYYGGRIMGNAGGAGSGADNHLTLNNTANTIANFRQSVVAESITVSTPTGGTTYLEGEQIPISWTTTGITGNVKISLRKSDGSSGYIVVESVAHNSSPYNYTIPDGIDVGEYFIKVKQDTVNGKSNNFTIAGITVSSPSSGLTFNRGQQIPISWTTSGITGNVKITLRRSDGSGGYTIIDAIAYDTGTYNYTIPSEVVSGEYFVKVKQGTINGKTGNITINASSISVTAPTIGQDFDTGSQIPISWTTSGITGDVKITLRKSDGSGGYTVISAIAHDTGSYDYNIPCNIPSGSYFIKVKQNKIYGVSGNININNVGTCISLSSPLAGSSYTNGGVIPIRWTSTGITGNVKITLRKSDGSGGYTVIGAIAYNTGIYNYTIPSGIDSGSYFIKVKQGILNGKSGLININ